MNFFLMALLFLNLLITSCGSRKSALKFFDARTKEAPELRIDPAWSSLKKNLFEPSCIKCHNPQTAAARNRMDLTQKQIILENFDDILYRMSDSFEDGFDYMPPKGGKVSENILKELKKWRDEETKKQ